MYKFICANIGKSRNVTKKLAASNKLHHDGGRPQTPSAMDCLEEGVEECTEEENNGKEHPRSSANPSRVESRTTPCTPPSFRAVQAPALKAKEFSKFYTGHCIIAEPPTPSISKKYFHLYSINPLTINRRPMATFASKKPSLQTPEDAATSYNKAIEDISNIQRQKHKNEFQFKPMSLSQISSIAAANVSAKMQKKGKKLDITYPTHTMKHNLTLAKRFRIREGSFEANVAPQLEENFKMRKAQQKMVFKSIEPKTITYPKLADYIKKNNPMPPPIKIKQLKPASKSQQTFKESASRLRDEALEEDFAALIKSHPTIENASKEAKMKLKTKFIQLLLKSSLGSPKADDKTVGETMESEPSREAPLDVRHTVKEAQDMVEEEEVIKMKVHPIVPSGEEYLEKEYLRVRYPKRVWVNDTNIEDINLEDVCIKETATKTGSGLITREYAKEPARPNYQKVEKEAEALSKFVNMPIVSPVNQETKSPSKQAKTSTPAIVAPQLDVLKKEKLQLIKELDKLEVKLGAASPSFTNKTAEVPVENNIPSLAKSPSKSDIVRRILTGEIYKDEDVNDERVEAEDKQKLTVGYSENRSSYRPKLILKNNRQSSKGITEPSKASLYHTDKMAGGNLPKSAKPTNEQSVTLRASPKSTTEAVEEKNTPKLATSSKPKSKVSEVIFVVRAPKSSKLEEPSAVDEINEQAREKSLLFKKKRMKEMKKKERAEMRSKIESLPSLKVSNVTPRIDKVDDRMDEKAEIAEKSKEIIEEIVRESHLAQPAPKTKKIVKKMVTAKIIQTGTTSDATAKRIYAIEQPEVKHEDNVSDPQSTTPSKETKESFVYEIDQPVPKGEPKFPVYKLKIPPACVYALDQPVEEKRQVKRRKPEEADLHDEKDKKVRQDLEKFYNEKQKQWSQELKEAEERQEDKDGGVVGEETGEKSSFPVVEFVKEQMDLAIPIKHLEIKHETVGLAEAMEEKKTHSEIVAKETEITKDKKDESDVGTAQETTIDQNGGAKKEHEMPLAAMTDAKSPTGDLDLKKKDEIEVVFHDIEEVVSPIDGETKPAKVIKAPRDPPTTDGKFPEMSETQATVCHHPKVQESANEKQTAMVAIEEEEAVQPPPFQRCGICSPEEAAKVFKEQVLDKFFTSTIYPAQQQQVYMPKERLVVNDIKEVEKRNDLVTIKELMQICEDESDGAVIRPGDEIVFVHKDLEQDGGEGIRKIHEKETESCPINEVPAQACSEHEATELQGDLTRTFTMGNTLAIVESSTLMDTKRQIDEMMKKISDLELMFQKQQDLIGEKKSGNKVRIPPPKPPDEDKAKKDKPVGPNDIVLPPKVRGSESDEKGFTEITTLKGKSRGSDAIVCTTKLAFDPSETRFSTRKISKSPGEYMACLHQNLDQDARIEDQQHDKVRKYFVKKFGLTSSSKSTVRAARASGSGSSPALKLEAKGSGGPSGQDVTKVTKLNSSTFSNSKVNENGMGRKLVRQVEVKRSLSRFSLDKNSNLKLQTARPISCPPVKRPYPNELRRNVVRSNSVATWDAQLSKTSKTKYSSWSVHGSVGNSMVRDVEGVRGGTSKMNFIGALSRSPRRSASDTSGGRKGDGKEESSTAANSKKSYLDGFETKEKASNRAKVSTSQPKLPKTPEKNEPPIILHKKKSDINQHKAEKSNRHPKAVTELAKLVEAKPKSLEKETTKLLAPKAKLTESLIPPKKQNGGSQKTPSPQPQMNVKSKQANENQESNRPNSMVLNKKHNLKSESMGALQMNKTSAIVAKSVTKRCEADSNLKQSCSWGVLNVVLPKRVCVANGGSDQKKVSSKLASKVDMDLSKSAGIATSSSVNKLNDKNFPSKRRSFDESTEGSMNEEKSRNTVRDNKDKKAIFRIQYDGEVFIVKKADESPSGAKSKISESFSNDHSDHHQVKDAVEKKGEPKLEDPAKKFIVYVQNPEDKAQSKDEPRSYMPTEKFISPRGMVKPQFKYSEHLKQIGKEQKDVSTSKEQKDVSTVPNQSDGKERGASLNEKSSNLSHTHSATLQNIEKRLAERRKNLDLKKEQLEQISKILDETKESEGPVDVDKLFNLEYNETELNKRSLVGAKPAAESLQSVYSSNSPIEPKTKLLPEETKPGGNPFTDINYYGTIKQDCVTQPKALDDLYRLNVPSTQRSITSNPNNESLYVLKTPEVKDVETEECKLYAKKRLLLDTILDSRVKANRSDQPMRTVVHKTVSEENLASEIKAWTESLSKMMNERRPKTADGVRSTKPRDRAEPMQKESGIKTAPVTEKGGTFIWVTKSVIKKKNPKQTPKVTQKQEQRSPLRVNTVNINVLRKPVRMPSKEELERKERIQTTLRKGRKEQNSQSQRIRSKKSLVDEINTTAEDIRKTQEEGKTTENTFKGTRRQELYRIDAKVIQPSFGCGPWGVKLKHVSAASEVTKEFHTATSDSKAEYPDRLMSKTEFLQLKRSKSRSVETPQDLKKEELNYNIKEIQKNLTTQETKKNLIQESKKNLIQNSNINLTQELKTNLVHEPKKNLIQETTIHSAQETKTSLIQEPKRNLTQKPIINSAHEEKTNLIHEPKNNLIQERTINSAQETILNKESRAGEEPIKLGEEINKYLVERVSAEKALEKQKVDKEIEEPNIELQDKIKVELEANKEQLPVNELDTDCLKYKVTQMTKLAARKVEFKEKKKTIEEEAPVVKSTPSIPLSDHLELAEKANKHQLQPSTNPSPFQTSMNVNDNKCGIYFKQPEYYKNVEAEVPHESAKTNAFNPVDPSPKPILPPEIQRKLAIEEERKAAIEEMIELKRRNKAERRLKSVHLKNMVFKDMTDVKPTSAVKKNKKVEKLQYPTGSEIRNRPCKASESKPPQLPPQHPCGRIVLPKKTPQCTLKMNEETLQSTLDLPTNSLSLVPLKAVERSEAGRRGRKPMDPLAKYRHLRISYMTITRPPADKKDEETFLPSVQFEGSAISQQEKERILNYRFELLQRLNEEWKRQQSNQAEQKKPHQDFYKSSCDDSDVKMKLTKIIDRARPSEAIKILTKGKRDNPDEKGPSGNNRKGPGSRQYSTSSNNNCSEEGITAKTNVCDVVSDACKNVICMEKPEEDELCPTICDEFDVMQAVPHAFDCPSPDLEDERCSNLYFRYHKMSYSDLHEFLDQKRTFSVRAAEKKAYEECLKQVKTENEECGANTEDSTQ